MKRKAARKHCLHRKIEASVLLKQRFHSITENIATDHNINNTHMSDGHMLFPFSPLLTKKDSVYPLKSNRNVRRDLFC